MIVIADDDLVTVEDSQAKQRALPNSQLEVVPNATHGVPAEKPDVVAQLVIGFLASEARS